MVANVSPHLIVVSAVLLCATCAIVEREVVGSVGVALPETSKCSGEVGEILQQIRALMNDANTLNSGAPLQAYIVPMNDAHQSEYVADHDKRLQYISRFTGSAGEAVVTTEHAVLWTDSRYHLQAEKQLDPNCWTLMKTGQPNVPRMSEWLLSNLTADSTVGVDPFLISERVFREQQKELLKNNITLKSISKNLVDLVWRNRPQNKNNSIFPLEIKYSGKESGLKIKEVLNEAEDQDAEAVVITSLDDIAWLLNLRGSDIDCNPVFFSYVILSRNSSYFFVDAARIVQEATEQLSAEKAHLVIRSYSEILDGVREIVNATRAKVVVSMGVSQAVAELVPEERRLVKSIVAGMKAVKNRIEAENMERAHIRDGLALIQYLHWLNTNIDEANITELSGAEKLAEFRANQDNFYGLSFPAISAVGGHASIVHYSPTEESSVRITRNKIYLIDSGGQYWDGTTDITRTVHFGKPKLEEKISYTRVLKGFIGLAISVFPTNTSLRYFDYIARRPLWQAGLDYGHGSGHGVGMFLLVHEYPPLFNSRTNEIIQENMFVSNEPGYYKKNEFGIRVEDVIQVVKADIPHAFQGNGGLTFKSITYAPLFTNLIVTNMLTKEEAKYVNTYNRRVMDTIGPILLRLKLNDTHKWLRQETRQICSW